MNDPRDRGILGISPDVLDKLTGHAALTRLAAQLAAPLARAAQLTAPPPATPRHTRVERCVRKDVVDNYNPPRQTRVEPNLTALAAETPSGPSFDGSRGTQSAPWSKIRPTKGMAE